MYPNGNLSDDDLRRLVVFQCHQAFAADPRLAQIGPENAGRDLTCLPEPVLEQTVIGLLKPSRVAHVLGCRDTAVELAKRWGADPMDAARAALLHDVTKALDGPLQLTWCEA